MTAWVPLVIATLVIGIFPNVIFDSSTGAVERLVTTAFGG
jgi:NADH:ubiquinone oxidoreductase subunit 4 (subunit M)